MANVSNDEENLALEIAEDNRLRRIGIDPDGDPVENMLKLDKMLDEHDAANEAADQSA